MAGRLVRLVFEEELEVPPTLEYSLQFSPCRSPIRSATCGLNWSFYPITLSLVHNHVAVQLSMAAVIGRYFITKASPVKGSEEEYM